MVTHRKASDRRGQGSLGVLCVHACREGGRPPSPRLVRSRRVNGTERLPIETFPRILKSGCVAERSRLRTAERFVNLRALFCTLSERIFWLTKWNRKTGSARPSLPLTPRDTDLLACFAADWQTTCTR